MTGNWPILQAKALWHLEIQADKVEASPEPAPYLGSDDIPKTSRQICDLSKNKTPGTRQQYAIIARGFEAQEQANAEYVSRIASLEEEVARLRRGKKKRAIPNPNRRFMALSEALALDEAIPKVGDQQGSIIIDSESEEEVETVSETEFEVAPKSPQIITRSGRHVKKRRYE